MKGGYPENRIRTSSQNKLSKLYFIYEYLYTYVYIISNIYTYVKTNKKVFINLRVGGLGRDFRVDNWERSDEVKNRGNVVCSILVLNQIKSKSLKIKQK